ncbi:MAG TPA: serine hydrolase domain-containing protein, partial [Ferruginibacter sp.]|nr:serine hydrolase domain-containing protein [Ferruginibacter sp.]
MIRSKCSIIASVFFLFVFVALAGNINAQKTVPGLDERLKNVLAISNLPGFAVAVVKDDQVLFSKGYGYADRKKKTPYTPETIQPVGSVSKTVIGLAIMQCIENGSFTLETDINDILPFKIINP